MDETIRKKQSEAGRGEARAERLARLALIAIAAALFVRAFFGVDITDESFYMADTLAMLHGNLPYALNNFFLAVGYSFVPLPLMLLYEYVVPSGEGIVLFSRLSFFAFHLICVLVTARVLEHHIKRTSALLYACCLLLCICNRLINFNYNTIPLILLCMVAALLYDAIERATKNARGVFFLCGFLSAVAVFANPAYACAVLLNLLLIPLFSKKEKRFANLFLYMAGGVLEILIVLVPLLCQAGPKLFWDGFETLLPNHHFPREAKSTRSAFDRVIEIGGSGFQDTIVFAVSFLSVPILSLLSNRKDGRAPDRDALFLSWIAAGFCLLISVFLLRGGNLYFSLCELGIAGAACVFLLLLKARGARTRMLLLFGLYPVAFALIEAFFSSGAPVNRFFSCLPALYCVLLVPLESEYRPARALAAVGMALCILLQGASLFKETYRDDPVWKLDTRVESGVYKGLFTVEEKAAELPRMEAYLNSIIEENDSYAFRDCFPGGYLMTHRGKMCDISSWDVLQYSYGMNTPAKLFDYYRRSETIPSVIVYVDYGRDPILSAEDETIRYNTFLDAYYELDEEVFSDGLFRHVMVFRYKGGFDGDYDRWVETYNCLPPGFIRPGAEH